MADNTNDSLLGVISIKKKFQKLYPDEEVKYYSYGSLIKRNDDQDISAGLSRILHWKGAIVISNKRIFFKSLFLSSGFFIFGILFVFFLFAAPIMTFMFGEMFNQNQGVFLLLSLLFFILILLFIFLFIRQNLPLTLDYKFVENINPRYYKRRVILDQYEFISFDKDNEWFHIMVDVNKEIPDSIKKTFEQ